MLGAKYVLKLLSLGEGQYLGNEYLAAKHFNT